MWESFVIHALLGVLQVVIKNPAKKAEFCAVLIQVRDTISEMYPDGCPK
jgi:hypothetical protein